MNSSRAAVSEPLEPSGENFHSGIEDNKVNPGLPPFKVLLEWLTYYHAQTGAWPEPEEYKRLNTVNSNYGQIEGKPILTMLPGKNKKVVTGNPEFGPSSSFYYDYRSSTYYRTALELIETYTSAARPVSEVSILTLSSILAWCYYPDFLARFKEQGDRVGMYLSLGQWSKELRMRKATLGFCLKELEDARLIEICVPIPGTTKPVKRFYMLAVPLQQPLPLFDPKKTTGAITVDTAQVDGFHTYTYLPQINLEPLYKKPEPAITEFPSTGTESEPESETMIMSSQINNYKNIKPKTIKHEHGASADMGTIDDKLEFLSQEACFPGYASPDGLTALDNREALKFASNSDLDLATIKKIHQQVLSAWSTGKCTRNPIGFFHYALTQHLKQKPASTSISNHLENPERMRFKAEPSTGTSKKGGSRFRPVSTPINTSDDLTYESNPTVLAGSQDEQSSENDPYDTKQPLTLNVDKIQQVLQERVVEALQDRFKQPELAETLSRLRWVICLSGSKLQLRLGGQGSDYPGVCQGELALIKIVVSQILKKLHGGLFVVEILTGL